MKTPRLKSALFILGAVLPLLVAGALLWHGAGTGLVRWPGLEKLLVARMIRADEDGYLRSLRDTHLGCMTLQYRPAQVVFMGDSHSYAGYDYRVLQRGLAPLVVGNCALAGIFPTNVATFLSAARAAGLLPDYLVFGISPEMFWDSPDREDRSARADREIRRLAASRESIPALLRGPLRELKALDRDAAARAKQRSTQRASHPDEATIQAFFGSYRQGVHELDYWKQEIATRQPDRAYSRAAVAQVCEAARRHGVKLGVVYLPESRWMVGQFSAGQREAFREVMAMFRACADWVRFDDFEAGGGPDAWFVDRQQLEGYPHAAWRSPELAAAWQQQALAERKWRFFDPDHMNAHGAESFSESLLPGLRQWTAAER